MQTTTLLCRGRVNIRKFIDPMKCLIQTDRRGDCLPYLYIVCRTLRRLLMTELKDDSHRVMLDESRVMAKRAQRRDCALNTSETFLDME